METVKYREIQAVIAKNIGRELWRVKSNTRGSDKQII